MRVRFENLGPIKKTEIDVRPLTVIIGPNNSGKTYVAYSIYGLWRELNRAALSRTPFVAESFGSPVAPWLMTHLEQLCAHARWMFYESLPQFFQDTSKGVVGRAKISFADPRAEIEAWVSRRLPDWLSELPGKLSWRIDKNGRIAPVGRQRRSSDRQGIEETSQALLQDAMWEMFPAPFLLPAERNALVITYKILANRRYRLLRRAMRDGIPPGGSRGEAAQLALSREPGDVLYPEPIEHFLEFLEDAELESAARVKRAAVPEEFPRLASLVEAGVQGGSHVFFDKTALGGRELRVKVPDGPTIDLSLASSSIKQLAPYLLYLRHRAHPGGLLIIDEPEMNLHPDTQVRFLESLAILVNLGVHVLVTTHSPYFVDHLNNLIQGKVGDAAVLKKQAKSLYLGDERAFLRPDQVGAYEMRDFKLVSLQRPEGDLRWDTLSEPFNQLQQKFFALYEAAHPSKAED